MKSSTQKKRKSDVNIDSSSTLPTKKERPWYAEEASGGGKISVEKERRKSIIGLGKGLLKKMRSSSALKERNNRDLTMTMASASTSRMPVFREPPLSVLMDPMPEESSNTYASSARLRCVLPAREFGRGTSHRGSARSMPPESDLIRGLCNSAIRRTFSSVSDSLASPQRFDRSRSMRLREKLLLSASMAELPEEEVAPLATCEEGVEENRTPVCDVEGSGRRSSLIWLRSKSRIFGSRKRGDATTTPLGTTALVRGSNNNLAADIIGRTPGGIIKRSSTNSKTDSDRPLPSQDGRCSDVSSVLQQQVRSDQKKKEADEAKLFLEKIIVSKEPVRQVLYRDGYDAIVVDVSPTGLPVSTIAAEVLAGDYGVELHKSGMFNPYKNGILKTSEGKPDIIYIVSEKEDTADKRVRVGVATGMREAFESKRLKKVLLYPFCTSEEEVVADFLIQQFLLTSYKALTWNPNASSFDGSVTLAGVTEKDCEQMQRLYEELLNTEIRPKIAVYEALQASASDVSPPEKESEV
ncbi:hypothetical protein OSTOST_17620 [Ostertagia ostertagi]